MKGKKEIFMTMTALLITCTAPRNAFPAQVYLGSQSVVTNFPNPFDSRLGETTILYRLETEAEVKVKIYDLFGNVVREYPAMRQQPGTVSFSWDGTNEAGEKVAKGGYLFVVEACAQASTIMAVRKIGVIH